MSGSPAAVWDIPELAALREEAVRQGARLFLAGGAVRDLLQGVAPKDYDFALGGEWRGLPETFARRIRGHAFLLDAERDQYRVVAHGAAYDFAPLRGEGIEEDLRLRDFTINAAAVTMEDDLLDPLDASGDLHRRLIRACSPRTFPDDPLRLLRAHRFAATLGFSIEEETAADLRRHAPLLAAVAAERVRAELFPILSVPGVACRLRRLLEDGLLGVIVEGEGDFELAEKAERVAEDLAAQSGEVADLLASVTEEGVTRLSLLKLAAFLRPLGRGFCRDLTLRLRLSERSRRALQALLALPGGWPAETERSRYRFFADAEPVPLEALLLRLALFPGERDAAPLLSWYFRVYPDCPPALLSGGEVMALLGLSPGPAVGRAMETLVAAERSGEVDSAPGATEFLLKNRLTIKGS